MRISLPAFALRRPITVIMLSISTIALGAIAWTRMPLNFLPRIDEPFIGLSIAYPGATPEQVEQQVAIPVEGELRTIPGLRHIRTISNSDGCFASMRFSLDTNMNAVTAEVRDRMERLKLKLPPEIDTMLLQRFSSQSIPVMAIGVFSEGDQEEFIHHVRTVLEPQIRRVDGVANVDIITPIAQKEVLIEFEQDTLRAMNLGIAQIVGVLRDSSLNLSLGELLDGSQKFFVRVEGEYRKLDDISNLVIGPNSTRLKDIATVRYSEREDKGHVALDGKGGAIVMVIKESEANTVATCRSVAVELERVLANPVFEGVKKRVFFDQAELITNALQNLRDQGIYGCIMSIGILFVFLHRFRPTIIVALAIPTSLLVSFVFMFFMGFSLNLITMVSMIIAVGMLVDNAIVVVENIIRHRTMGHDPIESSRLGAEEVGLAIFASTLTTVVVFVPMYYMETGQMSVFMRQLGLPLIVSLAGSLLIALTLVPLALSRMKQPKHENLFQRAAKRFGGGPTERRGVAGRIFAGLAAVEPVRRILDVYGVLLAFSLRWRIASFAALGGIIAVTVMWPLKQVGMRDLPKLDTREVKITVDLDQNYDLAMAGELFSSIERELDNMRGELGIKSVLTFYELGGGVIEAYLYTEDDGPEWAKPKYVTEDVMRIISARLPQRVPGAEISFTMTDTGASGEQAGVSVILRGDDTARLEEFAMSFMQTMKGMDLLQDVESDLQRDSEEMRINIDEALARQKGVSPQTIAVTVFSALGGTRLPYMKQGGREIPVWAQFREEDRKSKANLDNVAVVTESGGLVPLNQLVDYSRAPSASSIHRVNGKNVVTLSAKTNSPDLSLVRNELRRAMGVLNLPLGYSAELGDELNQLDDNLFQFMSTLAMAVILIYIVMASLFESYLFPLSILTTVPMSLGGAVWMLYFTKTQFDTVTFIGCILMAGVIVNNGIVIVDHIIHLRKEYPTRTEAIVRAGQDRFRPVMMTALTTILGLVPLALATTGGAATFAGLGRALIGGLTAGTVLTLFVVPWFYVVIDDLQTWIRDYITTIFRMGSRPAPARTAN